MKNFALVAMQKAVDIVGSSEHPTSKVAACLFNEDLTSITRTNYWPQVIKDHYPLDTKFGISSGTLHAETACILAADFATDGASICITDPFCPNCAKNIAESGIKTVYVDHKGFRKDFFLRREAEFHNMSMRIIEKAGISVYEVHRKEQRIETILEVADDYTPQEDNPIEVDRVEAGDMDSFHQILHTKAQKYAGRKHAVCLAENTEGQVIAMTARSHAAVGYKMQDDRAALFNTDGKYSFKLEPLNRLLMNAPRFGYRILNGFVYCSQIPTSRELVNQVGAGVSQIYIGNLDRARDDSAFDAKKTLEREGVIEFLGL